MRLKASRALTGCEAALPDAYGKKPEELAALMNECLEKYRAESGGAEP